jgi:hypothetical protein
MAIIVEFVGGFRDGMRASSESADPGESKFALSVYAMSHEGEIGREHRSYPDPALHAIQMEGGEAIAEHGLDMNHFYKVVSKTVKDDDTIVRFEFVEQEACPS